MYACREICFTFHDVSINTASLLIIEGSKHALHSTMFLLILDGNIIHDLNITFTFHDVSINTIANAIVRIQNPALHSTMFLLILGRVLCVLAYGRPLHSTMFLLIRHSINVSGSVFSALHSTMFLLILCSPSVTLTVTVSLHSTMFLLIPVVYSSLQYGYNLTTFCQSCHFIIFILIFIFLDSSHF